MQVSTPLKRVQKCQLTLKCNENEMDTLTVNRGRGRQAINYGIK